VKKWGIIRETNVVSNYLCDTWNIIYKIFGEKNVKTKIWKFSKFHILCFLSMVDEYVILITPKMRVFRKTLLFRTTIECVSKVWFLPNLTLRKLSKSGKTCKHIILSSFGKWKNICGTFANFQNQILLVWLHLWKNTIVQESRDGKPCKKFIIIYGSSFQVLQIRKIF
jgi:hypothetical protein